MISKASVSFIRISPRKVRYVIDLIRAKSVDQAQAILNGSPRRAGGILKKLLNQAVDAAEKNSGVASSDLVVSKVLADGGPTMRRFRAGTMGRGFVIRKRTSHITLELALSKKAVAASLKAPQAVAKSPAKTKTVVAGKGETKKAAASKAPAKKKLVGAK